MKTATTVLLLALFSFVAAWKNKTHFLDTDTHQVVRHFNCDVTQGQASAHFNDTIRALHRNPWHGGHGTRAAILSKKQQSKPIQVQAYFHVITKNSSAGAITPSMVSAQLSALNTAFNPSNINFTLVNTTYTVNDSWAVAADADMNVLNNALRQGSYASLNVYFHTDLRDGLLGTCWLPTNLTGQRISRADYVNDACHINAWSMPGGRLNGYNMGKTAVHEVGHWFGLLHTFEGDSCWGSGDSIADTPQEAVYTSGCPSKPVKDSCGNVTGVDPIHNYMDYSTDACYTGFTPLQALRMQTLFNQMRAKF